MTSIPPPPIRRKTSAASEAWAYLRAMIVQGRFMPGHPLSENEVSTALGCSRTPVREALIKLEEEGLIVVYPQYGSFVAPIRTADVYDSQFVRESLECGALVKAIERLGPDDAAALEAILAVQRQHLAGDPDPFFEADEALHAALMRIAGHERAWSIVEAAKTHHDRVRRLAVRNTLKRQAVMAEHAEIVALVLARDTPGAVRAMRDHLRAVFHSVEIGIAEHPEFFATSAEHAARMPPRLPPARKRGAASAEG